MSAAARRRKETMGINEHGACPPITELPENAGLSGCGRFHDVGAKIGRRARSAVTAARRRW